MFFFPFFKMRLLSTVLLNCSTVCELVRENEKKKEKKKFLFVFFCRYTGYSWPVLNRMPTPKRGQAFTEYNLLPIAIISFQHYICRFFFFLEELFFSCYFKTKRTSC